ncbi:MAG TPA: guanylate kinase [Candidatus Stercoripulliclostridium merdipullorum]|uniref:Guanylate kinase n=1 Tax=Candidatus Stercoripulliclostridium merdipullorum TaxID=2840952 RepID=A0A9D1NBP4_9FIRM|nr:guanylate kinase [Candidatus Stercoripulliclostridium merdipullorum]
MERKGILFVISGPSGAGKGTVLRRVLEQETGLAVSVSATTRAPRAGEIDGIHYHFKTQEEFDRMIENHEFLEYVAKFHNKYGTPKAQVLKMLDEGTDVILEIETIGAAKVRKEFPKAVLVFVTPSSYSELEKRLDRRGTEEEAVKAMRLKIAKTEYKSMKYYNYIAINDDLDRCVDTVSAIIRAERVNLKRNPETVEYFRHID